MRPKKYGEETKLVPFRIPLSKIDDVKKLVSDYLAGCDVNVEKVLEVKEQPEEVVKPKWMQDAEERNKKSKT